MNAIHETCPLCGEYHQGTACHQQVGTISTASIPMSAEVEKAIERVHEYIVSMKPREISEYGDRALADLDLIVAALKDRG
jgi:uncharacterized protein with PhoU and TrkA domain